MAASAHDVVAAIRAELPDVGVVKAHKLLYLCQGHHLALVGEPLFTEVIEAYRMGPVVADLWKYEKNDPWAGEDFTATAQTRELDNAQLNTIGYIISSYGHYTVGKLIRLTHREGPWLRAWMQGLGVRHKVISREAMQTHFVEQLGAQRQNMGVDLNALATIVAGAEERKRQPARPDNLDSLRAKMIGA